MNASEGGLLSSAARATVGIIGGSGLDQIDGLANSQEIRVATPFGDPSDSIVVGELAGARVAFLPRHGRGHRISPTEVNARANIYAMKSLGSKTAGRRQAALDCSPSGKRARSSETAHHHEFDSTCFQ